MTVKIGIIGAGRIGRVHAMNVSKYIPEANLVAIADVVKNVAAKVANELKIPKVYGDPTSIFEDDEIDAVLICSSTNTHADLIKKAANAGKHVFCEKPIALDLHQIDEAIAEVQKANVILQVGFHRRFDPSFRKLKEFVSSGKIGKPWLLKITSYDPSPPPIEYIKVSGGIFLDMTIHDFDMARFLLGDVYEIYAAGAVLVDDEIGKAGDVDTAATVLRFKTGAIGVITNCRKATYGHDQRIEILGEEGIIMADNPTPDTTVMANKQGYHSAPLHYFFLERYQEAYVNEIKAFVKAIAEGREPPVTGLDGKIPVMMGYAAKRSLEERRPVRLSEIDPSLG